VTTAANLKVIRKDRLWPAINYAPHPAQQRIHASRARHRVNAAGRRFGKSQVGGHELLPEAYKAFFHKDLLAELGIRMEYWIVGPNYTDAEKEFRVIFNDLRKLKMPFDRPGTYNDARSGNMAISLWGGQFIVLAKSSAHPESLVGEGLHGVVMAEAAKMKQSVWVKYIRPTLADFQGWSLWNSTPEGRNWFHDLWKRGKDPQFEDWESWRHPSWVNPYVFRHGATQALVDELKALWAEKGQLHPDDVREVGVDLEVWAMMKELTATTFAQEVECKFTEFTGRVYGDWDEEIHIMDLDLHPNWPVYVATDYGWTNPNVALFLQVDPFDNVNILGEYYMRQRTEQEFADDVFNDPYLGPLSRRATRLYPDPEDPGASTVLANTWKVRIMGGTGGLIKDRVNLIRKHLKVQNTHLPWGHEDRLPKLRIQRGRCPNLEREFDAYRYPDVRTEANREAPENPLKKDDHCPEALSRFFGGYFGKPYGAQKTRSRKVRITR
jgi:hypothetical protein